MLVAIEGSELPGRRFESHDNVHVGLCIRRERPGSVTVPGRPWRALAIVPGDAATARWECEVVVQPAAVPDFAGPFVLGNRGDRHLALAWGDLLPDGTLQLFRGTKLRLDDVEPDVLRRAERAGQRLVARLCLTSPRGGPRSASVRPPDLLWTAEPT